MEKLGQSTPTIQLSETSKRAYDPDNPLADYAERQGTQVEAFKRAGVRLTSYYCRVHHRERPALRIPDENNSFRIRYMDGLEPRHDSPKGYQITWFGLNRAIELSAPGSPLIWVNSIQTVIAAQWHGIPAFCVSGGESAAPNPHMIEQLQQVAAGREIIVAYDNDHTGKLQASKRARELLDISFIVRAVDLQLGKNGDFADFRKLHGDQTLDRLAALPEIPPTEPQQTKIHYTGAGDEHLAEYERMVIAGVERAAGLMHGKHFHCINPKHPGCDEHASGRVGQGKKGTMYYCTCGTFRLFTVAGWLGLPTFRQWLKSTYPDEMKSVSKTASHVHLKRAKMGLPHDNQKTADTPWNISQPKQADPFADLPDVAPLARPETLSSTLAVDPLPDYWLDGIPHGFLTLLLQYDPDGALPFVFIMRAIGAGLLDAQMPFTHRDLLTARAHLEQTPHGAPSDDTIYKWFSPENPALTTISEFVCPKKEKNSLGGTNSESYHLLHSVPAILSQLFHRARLNGLRLCYPADEAGAVVPFDATLLKAIGCNQPDALAQAIEPVQWLVDQKIADEQSRAARKLRWYMQRAHRYADSRDVIPFPDGMTLRTTADLRAALARGLKDTDLLPNPTKNDWKWELGIHTVKGVDKVLEKAGIHQREQIKAFVLNPEKNVGLQIRGHGKKHRAMVLHLELLNSEGQVVGKRGYQTDQQAHVLVCDHAITGGMVQAVYQLPNEYSLRELPPRKPRKPRVMSTTAPTPKVARPARPKRYPGQVDPTWLREHQINLLYGLGWAKGQGGQTVYINPNTGQKTPENASIIELLALLSGMAVSDIVGVSMQPEILSRQESAEGAKQHILVTPEKYSKSAAKVQPATAIFERQAGAKVANIDAILKASLPANPFATGGA